DAQINNSTFANLYNFVFYLLFGFRYNFFNAGGVNTSICNQSVQSKPRNLSSYRIKPGQDNRLRRVVNDDLYASSCFQCTDITSFTTDNTSFDFIIFYVKDGNRIFDSA